MSEADASSLAKIAERWGIFAAMCAFFIWTTYIRENTLNARIDATDEFVRNTLVQTITTNTEALQDVKSLLSERRKESVR